MPLTVHTARISYAGADRLDVTRKSAGPGGLPFAPSWALLSLALDARHRGLLDDEAWLDYSAAYKREMRASYRRDRAVWDALLARPRVVLVCYCSITPERPWCHRRLLAGMLGRLGAVDAGELAAAPEAPRQIGLPL